MGLVLRFRGGAPAAGCAMGGGAGAAWPAACTGVPHCVQNAPFNCAPQIVQNAIEISLVSYRNFTTASSYSSSRDLMDDALRLYGK